MVHQNAADDLRAEREEMHAAFAADAFGANQFEVGLIGQCGGLQRMAGGAATQLPSRHSAQLRVHGSDQAVEGLFVPIAPGVDQLC